VTRPARVVTAALTTVAAATSVTVLAAPASAAPAYDVPVEDYASYQPQTRCRDAARPGTQELAEWIDARFAGGSALASVRSCGSGGTSEHKDGRAIDWSMDATDRGQRQEVRRFLDTVLAPDGSGTAHALARRMGIMYVIWNDHMWASYDGFGRKDYRNAACAQVSTCSATLRHRDHVHISLSRAGGRADTSWYRRG
jgi:hypothetical protein